MQKLGLETEGRNSSFECSRNHPSQLAFRCPQRLLAEIFHSGVVSKDGAK